MNWIQIEFTVQTPMFLGGGDQQAEFRLASLRGALRYWFRALAAPFLDDDSHQVAAKEREIFGGGGAEASPSPVKLKPGSAPAPVPAASGASWAGRGGVRYLLGQGLYHYQTGLRRDYLGPGSGPGSQRHFFVTAPQNYAPLVGCLLWTLSTFGGLGARVRRGFGGIAFEGLEQLGWTPPPPPGASEDEDVASWLQTSLERCLQTTRSVIAPTQQSPTVTLSGSTLNIARTSSPTRFPSFSSWHGKVGTLRNPNWSFLLHQVGETLRRHRAPLPHPRGFRLTNEYQIIVAPWMRSPTSVSASGGSPPQFALAAFGLPIVFKRDAAVNLFPADDADDGRLDDELRRASPLWIRPIKVGNTWRALYHVFCAEVFGPQQQLFLYNPQPNQRTQGQQLTTDPDPWLRLQQWFSFPGI